MASVAGGIGPIDREQVGSRSAQAVELAVFLFLIVPSLALRYFIPSQTDVGFDLTAVATILRDLALVALIGYFLWRSGESRQTIGWTTRHLGRELALGVALFVPLYIGARWLEALLIGIGFTVGSSSSLVPGPSAADRLLALALVGVVAVGEETIFRGYLLLRLRNVIGSTWLALLIASAMFMLGHGYEGSAGALTVGATGAAWGAVYLWRRSLVAPMTMHFLLDAVAIILVPLVR
jgi:membrane protease YdiL (CAAX protease family)